MGQKHHKPEEIVAKLRQVEVLTGQGKPVADAVRAIGVTEATHYRWRSEHGGLKLDQVKRLKVLEQENTRLRRAVADLTLEKLVLKEAASGKLVSAARRRACVAHVTATLDVSERFACRMLGQHRATQRKVPKMADDEAALTRDTIELARQHGRCGYRRITALLRAEGWACNHKRVERIWRREGLRVPAPAQARAVVAERWLVHPAQARASPPRLGLRLRRGPHARRAQDPHAERGSTRYYGAATPRSLSE